MTNRERTINEIGRTVLNLHTLETRRSDAHDIHELGVWMIKEALERAYDAGRASQRPPASAPCPRCGAEVSIHPIDS